jgi:hypothetical protein
MSVRVPSLPTKPPPQERGPARHLVRAAAFLHGAAAAYQHAGPHARANTDALLARALEGIDQFQAEREDK